MEHGRRFDRNEDADQRISPHNRHGAQGTYDAASNGALDNEFGTHVDEEVIKAILEGGSLQESEVSLRTRPPWPPSPISHPPGTTARPSTSTWFARLSFAA